MCNSWRAHGGISSIHVCWAQQTARTLSIQVATLSPTPTRSCDTRHAMQHAAHRTRMNMRTCDMRARSTAPRKMSNCPIATACTAAEYNPPSLSSLDQSLDTCAHKSVGKSCVPVNAHALTRATLRASAHACPSVYVQQQMSVRVCARAPVRVCAIECTCVWARAL